MSDTQPSRITSTGRYLALAAALLGWLFDGAEMGVFSMVGRPAILDLLQSNGVSAADAEAQVPGFFGMVIAVFLVGAATVACCLVGWVTESVACGR